MNKLLPALVILLVACFSTNERPYGGDIPINEEIEYVKGQNMALLLFQLDVEEHFGVHLGRTWENVTVYWADTLCGPNGEYGIKHPRDGRCLAGLMYSCDEIYVAISGWDESNVCHSALIHEFAHCLSWHVLDTFDGPHAGEIWDLVPPAAERACAGFKRGDYE